MGTYTENYRLYKPGYDEAADVGKINDNMDKIDEVLNGLDMANAGAHNSIYRGKFLGNAVTEAQYAEIAAGTFRDLYIGDHWTISGVNWRVAAFDYYLNTGRGQVADPTVVNHHIVMVPDTNLYLVKMNATNTTNGGYVGSELRTTGLENAKTTIKNAFSGHVLKQRKLLVNAVSNGIPTGVVWCDSEVDIMNEYMLYGTDFLSPVSDGINVPIKATVDQMQLPLFALNPYERNRNRDNFWLCDVVDNAKFAMCNSYGYASYDNASVSNGVRPYFCIK